MRDRNTPGPIFARAAFRRGGRVGAEDDRYHPRAVADFFASGGSFVNFRGGTTVRTTESFFVNVA